jgi:hypothetical protein
VTAAAGHVPLRVAVDTNVLFQPASRESLLRAAELGFIVPTWSAQIAAELARVMLWRGKLDRGRRSITAAEYRAYRLRLYRVVDEIDHHCEIVRVSPTVPVPAEAAWARETDVDDLHVQLMARTARADCVVSWNHRDFPARRVVDGVPRGELCGILWITPDQIPSLQHPAVEDES